MNRILKVIATTKCGCGILSKRIICETLHKKTIVILIEIANAVARNLHARSVDNTDGLFKCF